eukprot:14847-Heterococcus_DN1.PRE.1
MQAAAAVAPVLAVTFVDDDPAPDLLPFPLLPSPAAALACAGFLTGTCSSGMQQKSCGGQ